MIRAVLVLLFIPFAVLTLSLPALVQAQTQNDQEQTEDVLDVQVQEVQVEEQALIHERPGNTELGFIVGEPTGISAKFWTSDRAAFDLGFAWSFSGQGSMHIHSNYLFHSYMQDPDIALYFGLGGRLLLEDDFSMGLRVPLGMQYVIPESNLGLFFELAPLLQLVPGLDADINGGLGLRYFF